MVPSALGRAELREGFVTREDEDVALVVVGQGVGVEFSIPDIWGAVLGGTLADGIHKILLGNGVGTNKGNQVSRRKCLVGEEIDEGLSVLEWRGKKSGPKAAGAKSDR